MRLIASLRERKTPILTIINIREGETLEAVFIDEVKKSCGIAPLTVCAKDNAQRSDFLENLTASLQEILPDDLTTPPLLRDFSCRRLNYY